METIKTGDIIDTLVGYLEVKGYNGSIVYCDEYETTDNGEDVMTGERMLTCNEIGKIMKEVDGRNHKVMFE